jgi:hypothetical protein
MDLDLDILSDLGTIATIVGGGVAVVVVLGLTFLCAPEIRRASDVMVDRLCALIGGGWAIGDSGPGSRRRRIRPEQEGATASRPRRRIARKRLPEAASARRASGSA